MRLTRRSSAPMRAGFRSIRSTWSERILRIFLAACARDRNRTSTCKPRRALRCSSPWPCSRIASAARSASMRAPGRFPELALWALLFSAAAIGADIRVGIVGTDSSHAPAFTQILNDASSPSHVQGAKVVAAYKGGSRDLPKSWERVDGYAEELRTKWGVEIVPDIATLCSRVDAVIIGSIDGRAHLAEVREVAAARKPMYIDKPMAATLDDARAIARIAAEAGVPWFTS